MVDLYIYIASSPKEPFFLLFLLCLHLFLRDLQILLCDLISQLHQFLRPGHPFSVVTLTVEIRLFCVL